VKQCHGLLEEGAAFEVRLPSHEKNYKIISRLLQKQPKSYSFWENIMEIWALRDMTRLGGIVAMAEDEFGYRVVYTSAGSRMSLHFNPPTGSS
jgi:hypothetical protein